MYFEYWDETWDSWFVKENEVKEGTWAELNKPIPILNDKKNRNWLKCCSDTKIHHNQKVNLKALLLSKSTKIICLEWRWNDADANILVATSVISPL